MALAPGVWFRLAGEAFDLEQVAEAFSDPPKIRIANDDGSWWLSCSDFEQQSGDALYQAANDMIATLNGVAQMLWGNHESIHHDHTTVVVNAAGVRQHTIMNVGSARSRSRVGTVTVTGGSPTPGPCRSVEWLRLARADEDVALVMRVMGPPEPSWADLYFTLEVVETHVGQSLDGAGLANEAEIRLFRHTANNRRALGHQARHGTMTHQPPKNPMPYGQARSLVRSVVEKWLTDMATASLAR